MGEIDKTYPFYCGKLMIFHVFFGRKKHVIYGPFSLSVKVEVDKIRSWHFIFMCFSFPH